MKTEHVRWEELSFWQLVFSQSKANGAPYEGENLTHSRWRWPTNTYLQRRRSYLSSSQPSQQSADQVDGGFYQAMREDVGTVQGDFGKPAAGSMRAN